MKSYKLLALLIGLVLAGSLSAQQYDDLYYDPDRDRIILDDYKSNRSSSRSTERSYAAQEEAAYDDEEYDYYDDYDYYYSSRIRRFHRPLYGFNFFDPVYVDMFYYDPFLMPGSTVLIYDDVFAFNNWYRWNRWNRWNAGWGFNNWGWDPWGWNSFGLGWNNWGWNRWNTGWGFNNWGWNSFGGGFYCPPTWGTGYVYNTINDVRNNTIYGPRANSSTRVPRLQEGDIRREGPKDVTNTPRQGTGIPQDRNTGDDELVSPRDSERSAPGTRARAHEDRRRGVESSNPDAVTPRERTTRESDAPRRTYTPPQRSNDTERRTYEPRPSSPSRDRSSGWDGGSSRGSSPRMDSGSSRSGGDSGSRSSGGSSSGPRSSSSSRRGGN